MSYIVLARKWRPRRFEDLVGQEHVSRTLRNAITMDRIAHAFLFTGVRGVGKTSAARILAMALNCERGDGPTPDPCGECASCVRIQSASAIDVQEIDGASNNSVEDVRNLRETVAFAPSQSRRKIYIIDEVHMLSASAFNALLKTLEEPPPHVHFIFATTEPHRIPVTILSRCQRYDFRRIPPARIKEHLEAILVSEKVAMQPEAVAMLAREAQGSMRDSLSLLDQVLAAFGEKVDLADVSWLIGVADHSVHADLTRAVLGRDPGSCLDIIDRLDRDGYNLPHFTSGYLAHLRDLIVVKSTGPDAPGIVISGWEKDAIAALVKDTSLPELFRIFSHVARAADEIARSTIPRVLLETTFIKLSQSEPLTTIARLLQAVGDLRRQGGMVPGGSGGQDPGLQAPPRKQRPGGQAPTAPKTMEESTPAGGAMDPEPELDQPPEPGTAPALLPADAWQRIVESVGDTSPFLHRVVMKATPLRIEPGTVVIGFDGESEFDTSFACEKDNVRLLERACAAVLGVKTVVTIQKDAAQANEAKRIERERKSEREQGLRKSALDNPVIREAQNLFGARVKDIKIDVE